MSWSRVLGHDAVVEAFTRAVRRGRLAHAYLFVGPAGVGKRLFADELAKTLLCEGGPLPAERARFEACDHCPACAQTAVGTHPDFIAVGRTEESAEVRVGAARELCQSFALKSARGRGKVAILDDADDLNEEAANCLLKTLEEPPIGAVLILVGTSPDRQLPTIVSRCQVVRFAPLPDDAVAEVLRAQPAETAVTPQLVRLAGGSPGQGLALADPALWEFHTTLLRVLADPRFDSVALGRRWNEFAGLEGKEGAAHRRRVGVALRLLVDSLSAALRAAVNPDAPVDDAARALAARLGPDILVAVLQRCLDADSQVNRLAPPALVVDALCDALSQKWTPARAS